MSGDGSLPERVPSTFVSSAAFQIVGAQPALGRAFTELDYEPGAPAVVVVGEALWKTRYASRHFHPRPRGHGQRNTIGHRRRDAAADRLSQHRGRSGSRSRNIPMLETTADGRRDRWLSSDRLAQGRDIGQARAEIETIRHRLAVEHPDTNKRVALTGHADQRRIRDQRQESGLARLHGCRNARRGHLERQRGKSDALSRPDTRCGRSRLRRALGASRGRIVRQLCMEGAAIAALSAAAGLGLAAIGVRAFRAGIPANALPYWMEYSIDVRVLAALVIVSSCHRARIRASSRRCNARSPI